jgi:hypothetical protein
MFPQVLPVFGFWQLPAAAAQEAILQPTVVVAVEQADLLKFQHSQ